MSLHSVYMWKVRDLFLPRQSSILSCWIFLHLLLQFPSLPRVSLMFPFWIILCLWFYTSCVGNCFTFCTVLWSFHCLSLSTRLVDSPVFLCFHADRLHQSLWRSAPCLLVTATLSRFHHCILSLEWTTHFVRPTYGKLLIVLSLVSSHSYRAISTWLVTWNQSLQTLSLWYNLLLYPGTNVAWPRPGECKTVSYRTHYQSKKFFVYRK